MWSGTERCKAVCSMAVWIKILRIRSCVGGKTKTLHCRWLSEWQKVITGPRLIWSGNKLLDWWPPKKNRVAKITDWVANQRTVRVDFLPPYQGGKNNCDIPSKYCAWEYSIFTLYRTIHIRTRIEILLWWQNVINVPVLHSNDFLSLYLVHCFTIQ